MTTSRWWLPASADSPVVEGVLRWYSADDFPNQEPTSQAAQMSSPAADQAVNDSTALDASQLAAIESADAATATQPLTSVDEIPKASQPQRGLDPSSQHAALTTPNGEVTSLRFDPSAQLPSDGAVIRVAGLPDADGLRVDQWSEVSAAPTSMAGTQRKILFLRVTARDQTETHSDELTRNLVGEFASWYRDISDSQIMFDVTIAPSTRLDRSFDSVKCQAGEFDNHWLELGDDAEAQAKRDGIDVDSFDQTIVTFANPNNCTTSGGIGGLRRIIMSAFDTGTLVHEQGHSLGLFHSRGIDCAGCPFEYGDSFDVMGYTWGFVGQFNFAQMNELGLAPQSLEIANNGVYDLPPSTNRSGIRALTLGNYSLEYRNFTGVDTLRGPSPTVPGVVVHSGTELIDTTPGSRPALPGLHPAHNDMQDARIVPIDTIELDHRRTDNDVTSRTGSDGYNIFGTIKIRVLSTGATAKILVTGFAPPGTPAVSLSTEADSPVQTKVSWAAATYSNQVTGIEVESVPENRRTVVEPTATSINMDNPTMAGCYTWRVRTVGQTNSIWATSPEMCYQSESIAPTITSAHYGGRLEIGWSYQTPLVGGSLTGYEIGWAESQETTSVHSPRATSGTLPALQPDPNGPICGTPKIRTLGPTPSPWGLGNTKCFDSPIQPISNFRLSTLSQTDAGFQSGNFGATDLLARWTPGEKVLGYTTSEVLTTSPALGQQQAFDGSEDKIIEIFVPPDLDACVDLRVDSRISNFPAVAPVVYQTQWCHHQTANEFVQLSVVRSGSNDIVELRPTEGHAFSEAAFGQATARLGATSEPVPLELIDHEHYRADFEPQPDGTEVTVEVPTPSGHSLLYSVIIH